MIVGRLTVASPHDVDNETKSSWIDEIEVMKSFLSTYSDRGSVFFEYSIPRMGRRVDIILIIDGLVFILEFRRVLFRSTASLVWGGELI